MKTIVKMIFGSHLYGTNNEQSDTDYKGVFLPTKEQIYLNKIPKSISIQTKTNKNSKNSPQDVDTEMYSLHHFLHLACEGETVALDMLHGESQIIEWNSIWGDIVFEREKFYTKNLKAFVGYARRQASKYGIKGSRLNDAKKVCDFLIQFPRTDLSLSLYWKQLPEGEHIFKHESDSKGIRMYEVCGRKVPETCSVLYAYDVFHKFYTSYGARAIQAANNENIDWKAISHALRAAYQVKQILKEGTITFPLKQATFLREVKEGKLDYQKVVSPMLENLIEQVEELSLKSDLPEKVDREYWDKFLIEVLDREFKTCSCSSSG